MYTSTHLEKDTVPGVCIQTDVITSITFPESIKKMYSKHKHAEDKNVISNTQTTR